MNQHLQQRVADLLAQYDTVTLATCGPAGPQIGLVPYRVQQLDLYLFVPHGSDHLFNLESQPELAVLAPSWKLSGRGMTQNGKAIAPLHHWQTVIAVYPTRLHVLSEDGQSAIETIDF